MGSVPSTVAHNEGGRDLFREIEDHCFRRNRGHGGAAVKKTKWHSGPPPHVEWRWTDDRPCTCHPMERPHPCARKFALAECKAATVLDPICYRWRHQKDEVWKYGHQPQHLVPPRGKELIGYYIVQPLYTADSLAKAREDALEEAAKIAELSFAAPEEGNVLHRKIARVIRALKGENND